MSSCGCARARRPRRGSRSIIPARSSSSTSRSSTSSWKRVLLGLALQGAPVAQRRPAPDLRRLGQELRDVLPRQRARHGDRAGRAASGQPVERAEIAAPRRADADAPPSEPVERARPATRRNRARSISTAPSEARCGVWNWQSSKVNPPTLSRATSQASATFDASVARLTIDSPKNARPSARP